MKEFCKLSELEMDLIWGMLYRYFVFDVLCPFNVEMAVYLFLNTYTLYGGNI